MALLKDSNTCSVTYTVHYCLDWKGKKGVPIAPMITVSEIKGDRRKEVDIMYMYTKLNTKITIMIIIMIIIIIIIMI